MSTTSNIKLYIFVKKIINSLMESLNELKELTNTYKKIKGYKDFFITNSKMFKTWSNDEEILMLLLTEKYGQSWKIIAPLIGKSESACASYYHKNINNKKFNSYDFELENDDSQKLMYYVLYINLDENIVKNLQDKKIIDLKNMIKENIEYKKAFDNIYSIMPDINKNYFVYFLIQFIKNKDNSYSQIKNEFQKLTINKSEDEIANIKKIIMSKFEILRKKQVEELSNKKEKFIESVRDMIKFFDKDFESKVEVKKDDKIYEFSQYVKNKIEKSKEDGKEIKYQSLTSKNYLLNKKRKKENEK